MKRAMNEGREGRIRMIQERLDAAREMPEDHAYILQQLRWFGQVVPQGTPFSQLVH